MRPQILLVNGYEVLDCEGRIPKITEHTYTELNEDNCVIKGRSKQETKTASIFKRFGYSSVLVRPCGQKAIKLKLFLL